ncbi:MAG: SDR family oxidoreductase [Phycisphaerae bacterium]|nr:SDR family oxidoreductase [Phycisphaerae bacterium]
MQASLNGLTVVVTGGSKGYGAGIAGVLRQHGADVWITGRDRSALEKTAERLNAHAVAGDVIRGTDWDRIVQQVLGATGRLDVLVNNAGSAVSIKPLEKQSDDDIAQSIAVNLTGSLLGCRRAAPIMKEQGSGTIINVSSVCQRYAWPGWSVYSAAKAGLAQASKCLYAELREHGVRVTTLVPSWGATEFTSTTADLGDAPSRDADIRAKCTTPEELGDVVAHICSLPPHLEILEYTVVPMVQEIMPL